MQIALAALVVLAVVPIAAGGMDINDIEAGPPAYDDSIITVSVTATVTTNLYFDVTGFGYTVSIVSGGERISVSEEPGMTIPRKGTTDIDILAEIPLTTVMMVLLLGAVTEDQETRIELTVRGSTLGGMISVSAEMDILVPTIANIAEPDIELTSDGGDIESMSLGLRTEVLSEIIASIPDNVKIIIGGTELIFSKTSSGSETDIELSWTAASGKGIIESIEEAIAAAGGDGIDIMIDGYTDPIHLTKEQAELIVDVLKMIMEMVS